VSPKSAWEREPALGQPGYTLVYDATCLGAVMAVAIWDHPPTDEELLQARLETHASNSIELIFHGP